MPAPTLNIRPSRLLITGESAVEFRKLRDAFARELAPVGIVEECLVRDIVMAEWTKRRLSQWTAQSVNDGGSGLQTVQSLAKQGRAADRQGRSALAKLEQMQRARRKRK